MTPVPSILRAVRLRGSWLLSTDLSRTHSPDSTASEQMGFLMKTQDMGEAWAEVTWSMVLGISTLTCCFS